MVGSVGGSCRGAGEGEKAAGGESIEGEAGGRGAARPPQAGPRAKLVAFGGAERGCAPFGARAAGAAGRAKAGCFVIFWGLGLRGSGRKGLGKSGGLSECRGRGSESSGRGKHWGKAEGRGAARPPAGRAHERSSWLSAPPKGAAPRFCARRAQKPALRGGRG